MFVIVLNQYDILLFAFFSRKPSTLVFKGEQQLVETKKSLFYQLSIDREIIVEYTTSLYQWTK